MLKNDFPRTFLFCSRWRSGGCGIQFGVAMEAVGNGFDEIAAPLEPGRGRFKCDACGSSSSQPDRASRSLNCIKEDRGKCGCEKRPPHNFPVALHESRSNCKGNRGAVCLRLTRQTEADIATRKSNSS